MIGVVAVIFLVRSSWEQEQMNPFVTTLYDTAYPISKIGFPGKQMLELHIESYRNRSTLRWTFTWCLTNAISCSVFEKWSKNGVKKIFIATANWIKMVSGVYCIHIWWEFYWFSMVLNVIQSIESIAKQSSIKIRQKHFFYVKYSLFVPSAVYICSNNIISRSRAHAYARHL